jgi:xanthine dehydrogenase YagR molybdenum-binding subunit
MAKRKTLVGFAGATREIEIDVPDGEPEVWGADAKLRVVGTAVPRVDGIPKATGRAEYTADVNLPGMLHGRMLRAPSAGGTLLSLDLSAAEKAPGVKYARAVAAPGTRIDHEGRDLAILVADTEDRLEDALALCRFEIEPGPVAATIEDALADGAPSVIPDRPGNSRSGRGGGRNNPGPDFEAAEAAMKDADAVLERTYRTPVQVHTPLEPHGFVVRPDEDGGITVFASTQGTFSVLDGFAGGLRLERDKVRVVTEFMGGGFGCKFGASTQGSGWGIHVARAALELKVPVRSMLTRREEMLLGGNRPSSIQSVKIGLKKDGTVLGYTVRSKGTAGFLEGGAGVSNPMIYELGKQAKEEVTVLTHAGPAAAFRAPGHPQGSFALESVLDEAANALGIDPLDLRLRIDPNPVRQAQYRMGAERFGWAAARKVKPGEAPGPLKRGVGMGSAVWYNTGGANSSVDVTVHRDGRVEVLNGAQDIGTGTRTVLAIIVAEVLGLEPGEVRVHLGRTEWPPGPGSGGSTTAPTLAPCARAAAEAARKAILGDAPPGDRAAWRKACARMDGEKQIFQGRRPQTYGQYNGRVAGVQFAEVEVDVETGVVRVTRVLAIQDCGRVVDRLLAESQVIGGVVNGISYALFEERALDRRTARLLHGDLEGYRIAGARDVPDIEAVMFEVANAGNSVGMVGLGEPPKVPTAGAIANAVFHATGARVRELPLSPARVLAALEERGR